MYATIKAENVNGIRTSHRAAEERNGMKNGYKAIAIIDGEAVTLADMRIAISKSGTPYACFWAYKPGKKDETGKYIYDGMWSNGSGTATGYGYHKESSAANIAISNAGISLSEPINGRGNAAIKEAVLAVGNALYSDGPVYVIDCHA